MSDFDVDGALVRKLADLLTETNLTELEYQSGDRRIRVTRQVTAAPVAAFAAAPLATAAAVAAPVAPEDINKHPGAVKSPMVGTAYLKSDPTAPPFIAVGDRVREGDTVVIIEAMKVFNPIKAPKSGTVTQILIESGQPVEFGEVLLVVE
jgi:acetyl-CoA carboxylase biotin carboxyl carrier protein